MPLTDKPRGTFFSLLHGGCNSGVYKEEYKCRENKKREPLASFTISIMPLSSSGVKLIVDSLDVRWSTVVRQCQNNQTQSDAKCLSEHP